MLSQFHLKTQVVAQEGGAWLRIWREGRGRSSQWRSSKTEHVNKESVWHVFPSKYHNIPPILDIVYMLMFTFPLRSRSQVIFKTCSSLRCSSPLFCGYLLCWQVLQHLLSTKNWQHLICCGFPGFHPGNPLQPSTTPRPPAISPRAPGHHLPHGPSPRCWRLAHNPWWSSGLWCKKTGDKKVYHRYHGSVENGCISNIPSISAPNIYLFRRHLDPKNPKIHSQKGRKEHSGFVSFHLVGDFPLNHDCGRKVIWFSWFLGGLTQNMPLPQRRLVIMGLIGGPEPYNSPRWSYWNVLKSHDSHGHHVKTSENSPCSSQMPYQNLLFFLGIWCLSAKSHAHPCETYRRKWKSRSVNP